MYTPRKAANPTITTRRACMALCSTSAAANRQAITAANSSAKNSAEAAIIRRCRNPREDTTKLSATASARQASNGVMSHGYQDFNHAREYGWYATSKDIAAPVASVNSGSRRTNPDRINCTKQTTIETKYTRSTCSL